MEQLDSHWTDFHEIWYLSIIGPTRRTVCFQFNAINSLYMFRALICPSSGVTVCTAVGIYSASWWWANKCSEHVEAINRNKLKANSASCWSYYTGILRCTVNKTLSLISEFFLNLRENSSFIKNLPGIVGTLHEDLCTFIIIPRSVPHRTRNVADKTVEKIKTRVLYSVHRTC
jgi:hypothetical protein